MALFHRYHSTLHGNYRRAALRYGLLTGSVMAAVMLLRVLLGNGVSSPGGGWLDVLLIAAVILLTAHYRQQLPDRKITLKEAMLVGVLTSLMAAAVYALLLLAIEEIIPSQIVQFTRTMAGQTITTADPQLHYWALLWAIIALGQTALLGSFAAFLAAVVLKNEKSEVKHKSK